LEEIITIAIKSMKKRIRQVLNGIHQALQKPYFSFIHGHAYLSKEDLKQIKLLVGLESDEVITDFESKFAKLVGEGEAVSYAAARMGFYELMRHLRITKDDEIILLGATCSVMVNAVIRVGATPIFSDIDPETYGSSALEIVKHITQRTKMIVAQHSFGIPCDIEPIVELAKERKIFLLEDCALTLGSKVDSVIVGNFGDAALFSTDHSKPLNTLTGGLIYTKNLDLARHLKVSQAKLSSLPKSRQSALLRRIMIESHYCNPDRYGRLALIELYENVRKRYFGGNKDFLDENYGVEEISSYSYPSKLPAFLGLVGLYEISRWKDLKQQRKELLRSLIKIFTESNISSSLPRCYSNLKLDIVPLRFAWHSEYNIDIIKKIGTFIDDDWVWFRAPIIATNLPLESFGYQKGNCPISEKIGSQMVNLPCNVAEQFQKDLEARLEKSLT
jgi:perosamine synthetase